ncbi:YrrS family protein [Psychrobacillus sp. FSL K6-2684]|jgi:cytoskeletal protein RodZ|uniref:YrrS family protein n=1 Tax=Psychrobacillus faecigallinarum TaxID=2762235 RepID=A0ABR8R821_9BACI|nr:MULTISPECIES: YrrS family protein [Psychrobacillus]MBD7943797.1 YrrS family protein [Psychrobacillus faecigallinarum]QEY19310.1 DUF1510 family protein [Psychrobacillus sp. AK 1817]
MPDQNQRVNSRLNNRKKKNNTILNVLIGIVLLLIIVVIVNLVTSDDDKNNSATGKEDTESVSDIKDSEEVPEQDKELTTEEIEEDSEQNEPTTEDNDSANEPDSSTNSSLVTTEESGDPNVESVMVDSSWEPIGTSQAGEHVSSYDKDSVDWKEKVDALAYAANLDPSSMYVKFLGNGGSPQKSIGTVTSKDGSEIYRISLEWVEGQGWKPTKKEKLKAVK